MSAQGPYKLRNIRLKRISLVGDPANEHARVVLFKRADPQESKMRKDDDGDMDDKGMQTCPKCGAKLAKDAMECAKCGMKMGSKKMIDLDKIQDEEVRKAVAKMASDLEAATKAAEEEKAKRIEAEKKVAKPAADPTPSADAVLKELSPAARALVEKANADAAKAQADAAKAQADAKLANDAIKKMADDKVTEAYVSKAKAFGNLPVKAAEWGPLLKRVAEGTSTEADANEIMRVLAAGNAIAKSLFAQKGSHGTLDAAKGAEAEIMSKAKELREQVQKSGQKLSQPEAMDQVIRENPDLYKRYLAEQAGSTSAAAAAQGGDEGEE